MKIVADENIPAVAQFFSRFGEIVTYPGRTLSAEHVADADILLVRSVTKVNQLLLEGSSVKFVGTCTIGVDHLDTDYLRSQNIKYANAPGCNADGVVQYDLAALGVVDEHWRRKKVGVIGCGNVGGRLLNALTSLGVSCMAYDPFLSAADNPLLTDLEAVLNCDVICMHAPYTTVGPHPTHHLINKETLGLIRSGTVLLNAGRGGAIDNNALLERLKSHGDLTVVLDVWEQEPKVCLELMNHLKIATSHIAGYGFEGKLNGSYMIFNEVVEFLAQNEEYSGRVDRVECGKFADQLLAQLKGEPIALSCDSIETAIAASYSILADDARFRLAMTEASNSESSTVSEKGSEVGKAFDLLRKTYPVRRELNHFKVSSCDADLRSQLSKIGFV